MLLLNLKHRLKTIELKVLRMEEIIVVEEWRDVRGYLNYQVSNIGRVRHTESGYVMKLSSDNGYHSLSLSLNGKSTTYRVHRLVAIEFIPNPLNKPTVDHINNKATFNNTVGNLRWATHKEQRRNTSTQPNSSSKYKGVSWHKKSSKWSAQIHVDNKKIHLGLFESEEEAALTYNKQAIEYFGDFANLNVIEHTQKKE